jgi:hypothetical protein
MSLAVDEMALDELAVDEMAVDDLTPHQLTSNRHLNLESNFFFPNSSFGLLSIITIPLFQKNLFLKEEMKKFWKIPFDSLLNRKFNSEAKS